MFSNFFRKILCAFNAEFKAYVQRLRRMGQRADGYEVHSAGSDPAQVSLSHVAGSLEDRLIGFQEICFPFLGLKHLTL